MLSAEKTVLTAHALLHIGGLSGAAVMLAEGHMLAALLLAVVATVCMLILAGGDALAQIMGLKVRQFVRRHEQRALPRSRDERGPDA
jgi:uncharacterized protein (DUF2384 family)